jgi:5-deoxy-glucuronate isomerase
MAESGCRHLRAGGTAGGPWLASVTPEQAGWDYSGLRVLGLPRGGSHEFGLAGDEAVLLPLAGSCVVECDGARFTLAGRESVFHGVTDFAYLPRDARARVSSPAGGRFALATARARERLAPRYGPGTARCWGLLPAGTQLLHAGRLPRGPADRL